MSFLKKCTVKYVVTIYLFVRVLHPSVPIAMPDTNKRKAMRLGYVNIIFLLCLTNKVTDISGILVAGKTATVIHCRTLL